MRLPRVRLTVRRLMAAVAVVAVLIIVSPLLWIVGAVCMPSSETW